MAHFSIDDVPWKVMVVFPLRKVFNCQRASYYTHRIHGAARKMVTWIPYDPINIPIYTSTMDPSWDMKFSSLQFPSVPSVPRTLLCCHRFPIKGRGVSQRIESALFEDYRWHSSLMHSGMCPSDCGCLGTHWHPKSLKNWSFKSTTNGSPEFCTSERFSKSQNGSRFKLNHSIFMYVLYIYPLVI